MAAAVLGYLVILYMSLTLETTSHSVIVMWMDRIMLLTALLASVDVFFNWTGIFADLPFQRYPNRYARYFGRLFFSAVLFLLLIVLFSIVEMIFGLL
jgi:hypothetical protein